MGMVCRHVKQQIPLQIHVEFLNGLLDHGGYALDINGDPIHDLTISSRYHMW